MKANSRDMWLAIALLVILMIVTAVAALQQIQTQGPPAFASFSSEPNGSRALFLWLDQLGYTVRNNSMSAFDLPPDTHFVIMLEPSVRVTSNDWDIIDEWVNQGGSLLLAGENLNTSQAVEHYDFQVRSLEKPPENLTLQSPLMVIPPVESAVKPGNQAYLFSERQDFVTHLAVEDMPVMVTFTEGEGQVILTTATYLFSNAGLKEEGNPALVLNVFQGVQPERVIWFDEWHHGIRAEESSSPAGFQSWLLRTPTGRSLMYVALVIFVTLLLRGRYFGRPVTLPHERRRRVPLEHITAIANLSRRAGHREATMEQYHHWLKRGLGRRYRISPALPDNEFVTRLAAYHPSLDAVALHKLMTRLRSPNISEKEMVDLANEVAKWLDEYSLIST